MNPKFVNKMSTKKSPFRTSFTQNKSHSVSGHTFVSTNDAIRKPISMEEYNKLLIQNQRLAKEIASLKSQSADSKESLRLVRNESIELKQQLSAANTLTEELQKQLKNSTKLEINKISDQIEAAVSLLMEEYLTIDAIKQEINQLEGSSQTIRRIMSSLQSLIDCNNQLNESQNSDQNSERMDSFRSFNSSLRHSLSSQEMDLKRQLSAERIRRDFHILNELSTIFEMSTENQLTSSTSDQTNGSKNTNGTVIISPKDTTFNQNIITTADTSVKTSTSGSKVITSKDKNPIKTIAIQREGALNQNIVTTDMSSASISSAKDLKSTKPKRKSKKEINNETNPQKKSKVEIKLKKKNENPVKTEDFGKNANDSMVYDFTEEDENKENILPLKVAQRFSKRVRNKRFSLERI